MASMVSEIYQPYYIWYVNQPPFTADIFIAIPIFQPHLQIWGVSNAINGSIPLNLPVFHCGNLHQLHLFENVYSVSSQLVYHRIGCEFIT